VEGEHSDGGAVVKVIEGEIGGVPLIVVDGDLDQSSKQVVRDAVMDVLRGPYPSRNLLFDLTDCTFMDSGGIGVLLSALAHLPAGGWLGLIGASDATARALTYTGFHENEKVRFFSSTSDAAATLAREKKLG
jgi:anti-anti-sigma factor